MKTKADIRRPLTLATLDDARSECRALLRSGYERKGDWILGQMCQHLRLTIDANMHGYPAWMMVAGMPLRPLLRAFALPRLLAGNSISGVRTAGRFVPPGGVDDEREVGLFEECVDEFTRAEGPLHAHPGFGMMPRDQFDRFHAAHAAHHLSFLVPASE